MKYEYFKESLEQLKEDTFQEFLKDNNAKNEAQKLFLEKLEISEEKYTEAILSLNQSLRHSQEVKETEIENENQLIVSVEAQEREAIDAFLAQHNLEELRQFYLDKKELTLSNYLANTKKNIQELGYKVNALDREMQAREKDLLQEITEDEKQFKIKLLELQKRLEFDIKKATENTQKEHLPLDRELLDVNDPVKIKEIHNGIKQIRIKGIEEIANLKNTFEKQALDLKNQHQEFKRQAELKIKTIKEEYQIKIIQLKHTQKEIKIEQKAKSLMYDFDMEKALLLEKKDTEISKNELRLEYIDKKYVHKKSILELVHEKAIRFAEGTNQLNDDVIAENVEKIDLQNEYSEFIKTHYVQNLKKIHHFMDELSNFSKSMMTNEMVDAIKLFNEKDEHIYNTSVIKNIPRFDWQEFSYLDKYEEYKTVYEEFDELQNERIARFLHRFYEQHKVVDNQIKHLVNIINKFYKEEYQNNEVLNDRFNQKFRQLVRQATLTNKEAIAKLKTQHKVNIKTFEAELTAEKNKIVQENRVIADTFANDMVEYDKKLKNAEMNVEKEKQELINKLAADKESAKTRIAKAKEEHKTELLKDKKALKKEYQDAIKKHLAYKKEKMKLL